MNPDDQAASEAYCQQQEHEQMRDAETDRVIAFIWNNLEKWTSSEQEKFIAYIMDKSNSETLNLTIREIFQQINNPH